MKFRTPQSLTAAILCIIILVCSLNSTYAQNREPEDYTYLSFSTIHPLDDVLYYLSETGEYEPIRPGSRSRGKVLRIPSAGGVSLYTESVNPETQESSYRLATEIKWAHQWQSILILITQRDDGYFSHPLDDSLEAHPFNSIRTINFTDHTIAIKVGENASKLEQWQSMVLPLDGGKGSQIPFGIAFQQKVNGEWTTYLSTKIRPRSNNLRSNFIALRNIDSKSGISTVESFSVTGPPAYTAN